MVRIYGFNDIFDLGAVCRNSHTRLYHLGPTTEVKNLSAKIEPNVTNILLLNILRGKLGYVAFSTVDINIEVVRINSGGDALG